MASTYIFWAVIHFVKVDDKELRLYPRWMVICLCESDSIFSFVIPGACDMDMM